MRQHRAGFTLVEILVVLAIIAILSALLFPVFNRARERGRQTNCASNLSQLYTAIRLYYDDERRYPASIRDLLPPEAMFPDDANGTTNNIPAASSGGYLKGGMDVLLCPSDDTESAVVRSSYGNIAWQFQSPSTPTYPDTNSLKLKGGTDATGDSLVSGVDPARWVYNAYGYDADGWAYTSPDEAMDYTASTPALLVNPSQTYNVKNNPLKYSLSNRLAPPETIVTHCVFHRTWTSDADFPGQLGIPTKAGQTQGSRDIVLRLDGRAKLVDVSTFTTSSPSLWQKPSF